VYLRGREDPKDDEVDHRRTIRTMQGIAGILTRMDPSNFDWGGKLLRQKYFWGLHDVSAVLLDPTRRLKIGEAGTQMYMTTGDTTYVFMPVTREQDMAVFFMLNTLAKSFLTGSGMFKLFMTELKARLTRIKLAFEGDAGAGFVDFAPVGALEPSFKYGFGKILGKDATDAEIREAKLAAVTYKNILRAQKRNEIILAYRQHGLPGRPSRFPMYAKGVFLYVPVKVPPHKPPEPDKVFHKGFAIVDKYLRLTGECIDLNGNIFRGPPASLGGEIARPNPRPTWTPDGDK
jgi:hypothetical protein